MKKVRKEIRNKAEKQLAEEIGFHGKYVDSLINAANRYEGVDGEDVQTCLRAILAKRKEQLRKVAASFGMNPKEYGRMQKKAKTVLADFHTGHSMGCYRILKINGKKFATNHDLDEYAKSCTWRPTYGEVIINMSKAQLKRIHKSGEVWTDGKSELVESGRKHHYTVTWK